jgi:hypothetical protein
MFEDLNLGIKEDNDQAQILIKITSVTEKFERAKKIIETLRVQIVDSPLLPADYILFGLDIKDMRDKALSMTEYGFL